MDSAPTTSDHQSNRDDPMPPARTRRRWPWAVGIGGVAVVVAAVLAFGVFGVQTAFIDREVSEAAPTFDSAAVSDTVTPSTTTADGATPSDTAAVAPTTAPPTTVPTVALVATGSFTDGAHPGSGTASVISNGQQAFVRLEDDFATDNGPDLRAAAVVDGARVDLGELKGNVGSQNYELPAGIDAESVSRVEVWCRRFDVTFTSAELT